MLSPVNSVQMSQGEDIRGLLASMSSDECGELSDQSSHDCIMLCSHLIMMYCNIEMTQLSGEG